MHMAVEEGARLAVWFYDNENICTKLVSLVVATSATNYDRKVIEDIIYTSHKLNIKKHNLGLCSKITLVHIWVMCLFSFPILLHNRKSPLLKCTYCLFLLFMDPPSVVEGHYFLQCCCKYKLQIEIRLCTELDVHFLTIFWQVHCLRTALF